MFQESFAAINYSLTPIRYELEMQPWESKVLPASIRNNSDKVVTLPVTTSDFQSNGTTWTPSLVRKSELVFPDQELSTWITLESNAITLNPWEEGTVNFNISVPTNATPGWHYWAVIFNNPGSETSTGGNIGVNVDYGIIILVNVSWEVIVDVDIEDPIIGWSGKAPVYDNCPSWDTSGSIFDGSCGEWNQSPVTDNNSGENSNEIPWYEWVDEDWNPIYVFPDSCPLWDFTQSRYDGECIHLNQNDNTNSQAWNWSENDSTNTPWTEGDSFEVSFTFPINNKWNTHIKPEWKIILKDENGNVIKAIWKETVINENWAVIGEKIVDYIPINDQGWNILPGTKRIFESEWKWFPYKTYDDAWNQIVNYWSPSEFYTQKNRENAGFLMFWQRVSEVRQHKTITADIEMIYYDEKWNPITFTTSKEFPVQYIEDQITNNPYFILAFILILMIIWMTWWAIRWWFAIAKKRKCWNCHEQIKSHWETCPYCQAIQNKRKHKAFEQSQMKQEELKQWRTKKVSPARKKTNTSTSAPKKVWRPRKNPSETK